MSLQKRIEDDLIKSMQAKDAARTETLRFLKSAAKNILIEKKTAILTDADMMQLINKQIKQRKESVDQFQKAGRKELAEKELSEIRILENYLPKQLSDSELEALAKTVLTENQATSKKDFGRMMKILNEKLAGQAENKRISDCLNKLLPS